MIQNLNALIDKPEKTSSVDSIGESKKVIESRFLKNLLTEENLNDKLNIVEWNHVLNNPKSNEKDIMLLIKHLKSEKESKATDTKKMHSLDIAINYLQNMKQEEHFLDGFDYKTIKKKVSLGRKKIFTVVLKDHRNKYL